MDEPSFVPGVVGTKLVWRGPVWMNTNWYLSRGLRRHGKTDLARHVEDRSAALVEKSGFREYYDPFTGEGHGAFDFSWTAVALDMLARLEAE
jgi:glycogen debranching enzyme